MNKKDNMLNGARQGKLSGWRRLVAAAMARDLNVFIIPGIDLARAHGLDIEAAGLRPVASPRHASVLLMVGATPPALCEAAAIVYAQMMRPRALFTLGENALSPLPAADVTTALSQQGLLDGAGQLRQVFSEQAFRPNIADFDVPLLQIRIEYTCPMHPEIIQDEPGSCPKCGMDLVPREVQANLEHTDMEAKNTDTGTNTQTASTHNHDTTKHDAAVEYTCPMHPEVVQSEPGSCPKCGMFLVPRETQNTTPEKTAHEHQHMADETPTAVEYTCPMHPEVVQSEPGSCPKCGMFLVPRETHNTTSEKTAHAHQHMADEIPAAVEYTCPMHPEVVQSEPGSCPKCGMFLVLRETQDTHTHSNTSSQSGHASMDHSVIGHNDMGFMSMIDVTKDLPRSTDGLPMEWVDAPFGPFFPGLPGGLLLSLTLDGDTVADANASTLTENIPLQTPLPMSSTDFVEQFATVDPLTPVAYQLLARQALENAAGIDVPADVARARAGALERERIASHLGWLALFGQQIGFDWLMRRAGSLQLKFQHASLEQVVALKPAIRALGKRLQRTLLLKSRTAGIGQLAADASLRGPVARAAGMSSDARSTDPAFTRLGFAPARREGGDALARLHLRLDEITHSLMLIEAAKAMALPSPFAINAANGNGDATVETPRGAARLQLTVENGQVIAAQLETPSTPHLELVDSLIEQQELGDALVSVGSLDLSPWSALWAISQPSQPMLRQ